MIVIETIFVVGNNAKIYNGESVFVEGKILPYEAGSQYGAGFINGKLCVQIEGHGLVIAPEPYRFEVNGKLFENKKQKER